MDSCTGCGAVPPVGASFCPKCGEPVLEVVHSSEEISVKAGDGAVEEVSGLKIKVAELDGQSVSFSRRIPKHPAQRAEEQTVGDTTEYTVGHRAIFAVQVLEVDEGEKTVTFLVTPTHENAG